MNPTHRQGRHALRLEWGATGAEAVGADADLAVVVDVLSFTTTLSVAVSRGATVLPFPWRDQRAAAYAEERRAVLAVDRVEGRRTGVVSLSPAAMVDADGVDRVVLPSPNGSSISFLLAESGAVVVGACLRNRSAVARWLAPRVTAGASVAVVAAGERWPDQSLRPAVEDLWGAGAVLAALVDLGAEGLSPEARVAEQSWRAVEARLDQELAGCASGLELAEHGFPEDVRIAARVDVDDAVPVLRGGEFVAAGG